MTVVDTTLIVTKTVEPPKGISEPLDPSIRVGDKKIL